MHKIAKAAVVLFVFLCAARYWQQTVMTVTPEMAHPSDFTAYYEAAGNVRAGRSPFVTAGYIYPPLLAFLLTPLASLPYATARWIWFLFSQACLLEAAWLIWKAAGRDWIAASSIAFVWAMGGAAQESLGWGQPGSALTLVVAIAITESLTQRRWRAATALGVGLAIKVFPGVPALLSLLRRQWRAFLIFAGSGAALVLLPWSLVVCCLDGPRAPGATDTWSGTPAVLSWGIPSVVLRVLDPPAQGGPLPRDWDTQLPDLRLPASHRWLSIGSALITLAAGIALLAASPRRNSSPFAVAALVSLSLAASPVCWHHYQVLQYPGLALLISRGLHSRRWGLLAAALTLGAFLYPLPWAAIAAYYSQYGSLTASLPTLYFWTSVAPFASLALFGLFLRSRDVEWDA
jgi:Glycosyltransferase family 87